MTDESPTRFCTVSARWLEGVLLAFVVVVAVAIRVPTLNQPLLEEHSFRQMQTAYTAVLYNEQGIDLLHPLLPVFGPPWQFALELPIFQAVASVPMAFGVSVNAALRGTCLAFFMLTALFLWGLLRRVGGLLLAFAALIAFCFSPFGLEWSRTAMIEYVATFGGVAFAYFAVRWRCEGASWSWGAALVCGGIGMLVKPETAGFWLVIPLVYVAEGEAPGVQGWLRERLRMPLFLLVLIPAGMFVAWHFYADSILKANPAAAWLAAPSFERTWNFGTLQQRLTWATWTPVIKVMSATLLGPAWILAVALILAVRSRRQRILWVTMTALVVLPPLVLTNVYFIHDYYLAAISPQIAGVLGFAVAEAYALVRLPALRPVVLLVGLGWIALLFRPSPCFSNRDPVCPDRSYAAQAYRTPNDYWSQYSGQLVVKTSPADPVVVEGFGWNPAILYESRRYGAMMWPPEVTTPGFVSRWPGLGFRYLLTTGLSDSTAYLLRSFRWDGAVDPNLLVMGDTPSDLRGAALMSTDAVPPVQATQIGGPVTIPCGSQVTVPRGSPATWISMNIDAPSTAVIDAGYGLAGVPVRSQVVVTSPPGTSGSAITLTCAGAQQVKILGVFDGPVG